MISFRAALSLVAFAGALCAAAPASADEIVLWSGARLIGRIVDKSADALVLETASAENVRIAWADIFSLQTDMPQDGMLARYDGAPRIPMNGGAELAQPPAQTA
jgi:hypothetical protein